MKVLPSAKCDHIETESLGSQEFSGGLAIDISLDIHSLRSISHLAEIKSSDDRVPVSQFYP